MKKMMKYFAALVLGAMMMTACSEDYLETSPTNAVTSEQITESVENFGIYMNGINMLMVAQQGAYGQGYCGMFNLLSSVGNECGNDWSGVAFGGFNSANMALTTNNNAAYSGYSWWFLYQIIGQTNRLLAKLNEYEPLEGEQAQVDFYRAQALTYRAYCYQYLVQIFSKRWMDSNNGASDGVILRLDTDINADGMYTNTNQDVATLAECYTQIYGDCDEAISLFNQSGMDASNFYEPSLALAYGVKARAALCREDWETAVSCAGVITKAYGLMSADEFQSGFHTANDEWIFGGYDSNAENKWYYTFGAYYGYNGYFSANGYNIIGNRDLSEALALTDIRRQLFADPELMGYTKDEIDKFFSSKNLNEYCEPDTSTEEGYYLAVDIWDYMLSLPGVYKNISTTGYSPAYQAVYQQFKFGVFDLPGVHNVVFMRAAEMYLTQAEALCKQAKPDYATAQKLLYAVNSKRDPNYKQSTKTGEELIDEIMLYRRAELWGEGHGWFDLKRTGDYISRRSYTEGGTFGANFAKTIGPNDANTNDWVWVMPLSETQYNEALK